jgi:hypothetical protein
MDHAEIKVNTIPLMGAIAIETKVKAIYYTKNLRKKYQRLCV